MFAQLKKELQKKDSTDKYNINKCKLIQNYTNGEIFKNLEKITNFIINIFNSTNPNQPISLKEELKISRVSFTNNDEVKIFEGYAYKRGEPRIMRTKLGHLLKPVKKFVHKGWNKRWVILKNDMISYLDNSESTVGKNVYWFDEEFQVIPKKDNILKMINL